MLGIFMISLEKNSLKCSEKYWKQSSRKDKEPRLKLYIAFKLKKCLQCLFLFNIKNK